METNTLLFLLVLASTILFFVLCQKLIKVIPISEYRAMRADQYDRMVQKKKEDKGKVEFHKKASKYYIECCIWMQAYPPRHI